MLGNNLIKMSPFTGVEVPPSTIHFVVSANNERHYFTQDMTNIIQMWLSIYNSIPLARKLLEKMFFDKCDYKQTSHSSKKSFSLVAKITVVQLSRRRKPQSGEYTFPKTFPRVLHNIFHAYGDPKFERLEKRRGSS